MRILERLDRTTLITQAEELGVARANILTRPELVDELLIRTTKKDDRDLPRARGFFGRARDLVARVIEKGLHLPDAAERLRQVSVTASQVAARIAPTVVPTVTLAEIYAAQGHRSRAMDTLRRVLEIEPDHGAAQGLLTKLAEAPASIPPAVPPPEQDDDLPNEPAPADRPSATTVASSEAVTRPHGYAPVASRSARGPAERALGSNGREDVTISDLEPDGFLDDAPLPDRYDVDECVAIAVDPVTLYVYWEVREGTLEHVRRARPEGTLCLRLLVITPSWDGPRSATRDFDVDAALANRVVRDLPAGAVVRAAIGWRTGEAFLPIAHAPALETPPGAACPVVADSFIRWTPGGLAPVTTRDADYASIGRALGHFLPRDEAPYGLAEPPLGSSELSAGFRPNPEPRPAGAPSSEVMI